MKVERVSYDVMTPSAARGILEMILWKPAIHWIITQIDVLKPVLWESVRRNEVGTVVSTDNAIAAMNKGTGKLGFYIEDFRQQRAGLFLRDVAYTIHACFELTDRATPEDTIVKFQEMFLRRAQKGQCFNQPYLGCREFSAHFEPVFQEQASPDPIDVDSDLGWMLYDMNYTVDPPMPLFFRATLEKGKLKIPSPSSKEVRG
jgi:CRISPR-associated protein Cas5d